MKAVRVVVVLILTLIALMVWIEHGAFFSFLDEQAGGGPAGSDLVNEEMGEETP